MSRGKTHVHVAHTEGGNWWVKVACPPAATRTEGPFTSKPTAKAVARQLRGEVKGSK